MDDMEHIMKRCSNGGFLHIFSTGKGLTGHLVGKENYRLTRVWLNIQAYQKCLPLSYLTVDCILFAALRESPGSVPWRALHLPPPHLDMPGSPRELYGTGGGHTQGMHMQSCSSDGNRVHLWLFRVDTASHYCVLHSHLSVLTWFLIFVGVLFLYKEITCMHAHPFSLNFSYIFSWKRWTLPQADSQWRDFPRI